MSEAGFRPEAAARRLAEAWSSGTLLEELPQEERPADLDQAYDVQMAVVDALGQSIVGWKIGCSSKRAQRILDASGPFAGPLFEGRLNSSPARLLAGAYSLCGLEGEFAFRLAQDLPPRDHAYHQDEVAAAAAALLPAIEVIGPRYRDWLRVGLPSIVADLGGHGALVVGAPVTDWRGVDLAWRPVGLFVNDELKGEGRGVEALEGPLTALTWLANHLRTGPGLIAGQIVSTGTCTGLAQAKAGDRVRADFGRFGAVEIAFV